METEDKHKNLTFRLVFIDSKKNKVTEPYNLKKRTVMIGSRLKGVFGHKIQLSGYDVAHTHAQIYKQGGKVMMINLTRDPTSLLLNKHRVFPGCPVELRHNDIILIGAKMRIRFEHITLSTSLQDPKEQKEQKENREPKESKEESKIIYNVSERKKKKRSSQTQKPRRSSNSYRSGRQNKRGSQGSSGSKKARERVLESKSQGERSPPRGRSSRSGSINERGPPIIEGRRRGSAGEHSLASPREKESVNGSKPHAMGEHASPNDNANTRQNNDSLPKEKNTGSPRKETDSPPGLSLSSDSVKEERRENRRSKWVDADEFKEVKSEKRSSKQIDLNTIQLEKRRSRLLDLEAVEKRRSKQLDLETIEKRSSYFENDTIERIKQLDNDSIDGERRNRNRQMENDLTEKNERKSRQVDDGVNVSPDLVDNSPGIKKSESDTLHQREIVKTLSSTPRAIDKYCIKGDIWEKYDISTITVIGSGGQGMVYKVQQKNSDNIVAIKQLSLTDEVGQKYLKREVIINHILRTVGVKGVAAAKEMFMHQDNVYLVFEWIANGSVAQLLNQYIIEEKRAKDGAVKCSRETGIGEEGALAIGVQILDTLTHLHKLKVAHRDIKPENVLVGADNCVYLGDFGCSIIYGENPVLQSRVGTPGYTDPDVWKNRSKGYHAQASDVYSFGKLLQELAGAGTLSIQFKELIAECELSENERPTFITLSKNLLWSKLRVPQVAAQLISVLLACGNKIERLKEDLTEVHGSYFYAGADDSGEGDIWSNWSYTPEDSDTIEDDNNYFLETSNPVFSDTTPNSNSAASKPRNAPLDFNNNPNENTPQNRDAENL